LIELENKEITSIDKKFLQKAVEIINKHLSDTSFSVEMLADEISMSRRNLERKLASLTGDSPGDLIRRLRLIYASKLLTQKSGILHIFQSAFVNNSVLPLPSMRLTILKKLF